MDRDRAKELLPIIEHFANGGEIHVRAHGRDWREALNPNFCDELEYRIRPKPIECWAVIDKTGAVTVCESESQALNYMRLWNEEYPRMAPHRVTILVEPED